MLVGVLLVRLCSASLQTGGELTHPAVRLTIGKQVLQPIRAALYSLRGPRGLRRKPSRRLTSKLTHRGPQVRQTVHYASLNGGRVTWDATPFAFAMAIDPNAPTEVCGRHDRTRHWSGNCCLRMLLRILMCMPCNNSPPVVHSTVDTAPLSGLCEALQIAVQVGNVSASLGDRLWATWFSSAKEYARATTPIAIIRVNVQVQQGCLLL